MVIATATVLAAALLGGVVCPALLILLAVLIPARIAQVATVVARMTLLLSLPLIVSVVLVNVFFIGGSTVLFELGPLSATAEGVASAAEVVMRVLTMAGAVTLFYRTTRPGELVVDLEGRGVSSRLTFVIHNAIAMVPRMAQRAAEVTAAQRARGLETERGLGNRARGVVAIAAPTVIGAIEEAEARTMALEARGFGRTGSRTQLWTTLDSSAQRGLRWSLAVAVVALALARVSGVALPC